mmetsp:Transcript_113052/g.314652  ORF Transcript_113052/g.314652 Transcript_113052/m.314652 type:complete len:510 (-) Transcript_113052:153-1682(-)|eukprot:CAMPEP_0179040432 /NCGR_PEP_ID=MMETSP0796-20121207/15645_1 /TAXON_ID=73915 /ORGANISM="Pyrodinium bahamense, Strain pbaha01" /LENGTH=509 /DNA_ID=CAMNT_0020736779 /DNA_START=138 /DNA_END=1667 /DNA_ORIENTATION=+
MFVLLVICMPALAVAVSCLVPGAENITMFLPYHQKTIEVPPVPTDVSLYAYATDNALVAVPSKCYDHFADRLGAAANFADRQPEGPNGMLLFRISRPAEEYALLAEMSSCACGLVVEMHGSSGARWQSISYAAMMSGFGYVVVIPDSYAVPESLGFKAAVLKDGPAIDTSNYCGAFETYESRCGTFDKPFCYSTKAENVLHDSEKYREYVERNYLARKLELDYFVENQGPLLDAFDRVFLLGRSEGAMVAGRYYHEALFARLSGLILSGWSCEFNYYVSCAENARICEDQCDKSLPILNINGQDDDYFGASDGVDSVSEKVAANTTHGYGGPLTGNCRAAINAQGFAKSTVVDFPGVSHSIMYSHDNALRSLLADFLASPETPATWGSLQRPGCTWSHGVYECQALRDSELPCVSYEVNPKAQWNFTGKVLECPKPVITCGDVRQLYRENSCCGTPQKEVHVPSAWMEAGGGVPEERRLAALKQLQAENEALKSPLGGKLGARAASLRS